METWEQGPRPKSSYRDCSSLGWNKTSWMETPACSPAEKKKWQKAWPGKFPNEEKQMANTQNFFSTSLESKTKIGSFFPPIWLARFPSFSFLLLLVFSYFLFKDDTHRWETRERALSHTAGSPVNWHSLSGGQFGRLYSKPYRQACFLIQHF